MITDEDSVSVGGGSSGGGGGGRHRRWHGNRETIVSVIVPDKRRHDDEEEKRRRKKRLFTPSIVEYVKVLSMLYAIISTIVGFIFPISEALTNKWLNATYCAVFLTYQLVVATAFLVYLQLLLLFEKKRSRTKERTSSSSATASKAVAGGPQLINGSKATIYPDDDVNKQSSVSGINNNYLFDPSFDGSNDDRLRPYFAIRFRNRTTTTTTMMSTDSPPPPPPTVSDDEGSVHSGFSTVGGGSTMSVSGRRKQSVDFDDRLTTVYDDDDDLCSASQASVAWMDVSKFGSIFSHEGSSLFLKVGALLFSLGNIIYYSLEIENSFNQSDYCRSKYRHGWTFIPRLVFVVVQTFFIFKGPNVKVEDHLPIIWFGMLHVVTTNICLWFRTVVREIMEEFQYSTNHSTPNSSNATFNASSSDKNSTSDGTSSSPSSSFSSCENDLLHSASRYLFPFILEYSLIAVGTVACILESIAQPTDSEGHLMKGLKNLIKVCSFHKKTTTDLNDQSSSGSTDSNGHHVGHHGGRPILNKSHGGLFIGALLFSGIVVAIVLFYFHGSKESTAIYLIADLVNHSCLLIGCIVALVLLRPLAYVAKPLSSDDALLIIAMCGSALYEIAIIIASSSAISGSGHPSEGTAFEEPLRLSASVVAGLQTVVQSMFVLCALRRYPSSEDHVAKMPGRGTVAFLIVGNVSVWVLRTVLTKASDMSTPTEFYGEVPWLLIMNINLPLLLFFRFHCSVCLADIWHIAYSPLQFKMPKMRRRHSNATTATAAAAAAAASASARIDLSQGHEQQQQQVPQICVISPSRSQSCANIQDNDIEDNGIEDNNIEDNDIEDNNIEDNASLSSCRSTTM